jgi:hypothetical protein
MTVLNGYDYDEYQVYVTLPRDKDGDILSIDDVINAGLVAMGYEPDETIETNWVDSHSN